MKRIAAGRKNWLFAGSDAGGRALLRCSTASPRRASGTDFDPWVYLRDVLHHLPTQPVERLEELLPGRWQPEPVALPPPQPPSAAAPAPP